MRLKSAPRDLVAGNVEGFQFHIAPTIAAVQPSSWDELCASADADPLLTRRFLQALEDAPPIACSTRYLLLSDPRDERDRGSAVYSALAVVTLLPFDLSALAGSSARALVGALRRIVPRLLHVRVAACALSVSLGQSGVLIRPGVDERRAMRAIDTLLRRLARQARASVLAYQDLGPHDGARVAALVARGYGRVPNLPCHTIEPRFRDFADYVSQLRTGHRKNLRRTQRRLREAGVTLERLNDPAQIVSRYDEAAHRLYLAVVARAEFQYEVLSVATFHALARAFPGELTWLLARAPSGEVIGYTWSLLVDGRYYGLYTGMDYNWNARCELYFNLLYAELAYALDRGARRIELGQTADGVKARLGCAAEERAHCLRARGALPSFLLRALLPLLAPQPARAPALHVFREGAAMDAAATSEPTAWTPSPHE